MSDSTLSVVRYWLSQARVNDRVKALDGKGHLQLADESWF